MIRLQNLNVKALNKMPIKYILVNISGQCPIISLIFRDTCRITGLIRTIYDIVISLGSYFILTTSFDNNPPRLHFRDSFRATVGTILSTAHILQPIALITISSLPPLIDSYNSICLLFSAIVVVLNKTCYIFVNSVIPS